MIKVFFLIVLSFVVGLCLLILQLGFFQLLFFPLNYINLPLIAVLLAALVFKKPIFFLFLLPTIFFTELFSSLPFGSIIFATSASTFAARYLIFRFLTNRSIWITVVSSVLGVIMFQIFIFIASGISDTKNFVFIFNTNLAKEYGGMIFINIPILLVIYKIYLRLFKILMPTYLTNRRLFL